jgi:hypothetical protein
MLPINLARMPKLLLCPRDTTTTPNKFPIHLRLYCILPSTLFQHRSLMYLRSYIAVLPYNLVPMLLLTGDRYPRTLAEIAPIDVKYGRRKVLQFCAETFIKIF